MGKLAPIYKTVLLIFFILTLLTCDNKPSEPEKQTNNTSPTAFFTISPVTGTTETNFIFDASSCTDNEDSTSALQVRWDWENDGVWDTNFSTTKIATHKYATEGTKTIDLQVRDTGGLINSTIQQVSVELLSGSTGTVTDIDGNIYITVKIGDQWWMAENLKVTHYSNGDAIPYVINNSEWAVLTTGAYCYYENSSSHVAVYGALYNHFTVNDSRKVAPTGWHVPTDAEWQTLIEYLGGKDVAGGKMREAGTAHWNSPNTGATNEYGFTALPGGERLESGNYKDLGVHANFWTATERSSTGGWYIYTGNKSAYVDGFHNQKQNGYSVRCVRGEPLQVTLSSIQITPGSTTLNNNETVQFTCSATYSDLSMKDVTDLVTWSTSPGNAGSINSNGLFTAHYTNSGTETITASYQGQTDEATVSVHGNELETGTMTDIDGNVYKTVKIGDQWWMAENLKVTHYRNGDPIPNVTDDSEWTALKTGAYCYYDNDSSNAAVYGVLYIWYAVNDSRNIAPAGWHVPTDEEWKQLEMHLGLSPEEADYGGPRGRNEGGKLKEVGTSHWNSPNEGATNESGFTALPGGWRSYGDGHYNGMGSGAYFWSSTVSDYSYVWVRMLRYDSASIGRYLDELLGFSVRCVRD